jgi:hypothetical protein
MFLFYALSGIMRAQDNKDFDFIKYMEGSWKFRTIDQAGTDINNPNVITYVRSTSGSAIYGDLDQVSKVLKQDKRSGLLLMLEVFFSTGKPVTSVLIGKYDSEKRWIEWYVGNADGPRKLIWKIQGDNKIITEMDAVWVKERRQELEKSLIPRDLPTKPDRVYVMERIK